MSNAQIDAFIASFDAVAGIAHVVDTSAGAAECAARIIQEAGLTRIACAQTDPDFTRALLRLSEEGGFNLRTEPYPADALPLGLDDVQVGITGIDFGIAQTGTLVEVAANDATRLVSSMPRTYIGLLHARDIVPMFFDAAARLREVFQRHESHVAVSFISGPSRTGDIEMILTLGVHGPEKAHAIVIRE